MAQEKQVSDEERRHAVRLLLEDGDKTVGIILDLVDAAKGHRCERRHWSWLDNPPHCPICDALERLGET